MKNPLHDYKIINQVIQYRNKWMCRRLNPIYDRQPRVVSTSLNKFVINALMQEGLSYEQAVEAYVNKRW